VVYIIWLHQYCHSIGNRVSDFIHTYTVSQKSMPPSFCHNFIKYMYLRIF